MSAEVYGTDHSVAYAGIAGAYGEEAAIAQAGASAHLLPCNGFDGVFDALHNGAAEVGVVPIENSLAGSVLENYDLLLESDTQIVGEVTLPIEHSLLAPAGRSLSDITHCYSHPQALAQCAAFLTSHDIEPRAASNTAVAARDVVVGTDPGAAAIASSHAGRIYGLTTLAASIQTRADNTTRFFAVATGRPSDLAAEKASIAFTTANQPGALLACLTRFADRSLNMTKLESRPTGRALWEYYFYADIERGDGKQLDDSMIDELIASLGDRTEFVRVLGRYPRAGAREGHA
jgi:prephenate dehydratase